MIPFQRGARGAIRGGGKHLGLFALPDIGVCPAPGFDPADAGVGPQVDEHELAVELLPG